MSNSPDVAGMSEMADNCQTAIGRTLSKRRLHSAVLQEAMREKQLAIAQHRNALELASSEARVKLQSEAARHRDSCIKALSSIVEDPAADQRARAAASKELIRLDAGEFRGSAIGLNAQNMQINLYSMTPEEEVKYKDVE